MRQAAAAIAQHKKGGDASSVNRPPTKREIIDGQFDEEVKEEMVRFQLLPSTI